MNKSRQSNKEQKKHALLTPKEKRVAKQIKKHPSDAVLIVPPR